MKKTNSQGFSIVEVLIVVVVLVVLGAVAYVGYNNFIASKSQGDTAQDGSKKTTTPKDDAELARNLSGKLEAAKKAPAPSLKTEQDLRDGIETIKKVNDTTFDTSAEVQQFKEMGAKFSN